ILAMHHHLQPSLRSYPEIPRRTGRRAELGTSGLPPRRPFPDHLPGALVLAQAQEPRMAELSVPGPLGEPDLSHQPGFHPVHTGPGKPSGREGRTVALQGTEPSGQAIERPVVEPGPHLPGVDEIVAAVVADQEGAEAPPRSLGIGKAADHELLLVHA